MACTEPLLRKQIGTLHCDGSAFYRTVWLQKTRSLTSVAGLFNVADQQSPGAEVTELKAIIIVRVVWCSSR
jgi:hypothetical protein